MSHRDLQEFTVLQLKERLKSLGLSTAGTKNELIAKLLQTDPCEAWVADMSESTACEPEEVPSTARRVSSGEENTAMELLRREKEIAERELELIRREVELMRQVQQLNMRQGTQRVTPEATNGLADHRKMNIKDISTLLGSFDGSSTPYERWEKQLRWIIAEYNLSEQETRIIINSSMKGNALEWYHSRSDYVRMPLEEFITEIKSMFHSEPVKAERRTRFEERVWKKDEDFKRYFHEKVILANQVPIDEEEMVENIIRGIPDPDLRDQARMHGFKTKALLLKAFESVRWRNKTNTVVNVKCKDEKRFKDYANRSENASYTNTVIKRCRSCGSKNHLEPSCPTKDKGIKCFECRDYGHKASACPTRKPPVKDSLAVSKSNDGKYFKDVSMNGQELVALVDTGSDLCLMRATKYIEIGAPRLQRNEIRFRGVGANNNRTLGEFDSEILIDGNAYPIVVRVISDELMRYDLLIGADFLRTVEIKITEKNITITKIERPKELSDASEILGIDIYESNAIDVSGMRDTKHKQAVENMIRSYNPIKTRDVEIKMTIVLKDEEPVYQRARRLSPSEKEIVNVQINEWLREGIVQPSLSEFASPIVLVKKKNGTNRLCVDYRQINKKIVKDRYPLPLIEDQIDSLQNAKIFSTLDLKNGFFHVPVEKDSRKYTAFIVPDGQYEFLRVPFGLCNSPAVFQKYINAVFRDLIAKKVVLTYMDDLIVPAPDYENGLQKLQIVLNTAAQYGLIVNWEKCCFLQNRVEFLGHIIENGEVRPSERKTEAVMKFPKPKTAKQVQSFLGLTGYFRKFIPNYSIIARPLTNLLRSNVIFHFDKDEECAFERLKEELSDKPVLRLYRTNAETELHTDASKYGYGSILFQRDSDDCALHPVYYASGKTTAAEEKYTSYELEVLAIVRSLRKFRVYLLGVPFKIVTDCRAFTLTMKKKDLCVRVARWALLLEEFQYTIEHKSGKGMAHVDALSRNPLPTCLAVEENEEGLVARLRKAQREDSNLQKIIDMAEDRRTEDYIVRGDLLYRKIDDDVRLVVPKSMQSQIIRRAHERGHFAVSKTETLVKRDYWFPNMKSGVEKVIRNCISCILAERKGGKQEGLLHSIDKGEVPLHTYHIDHLGPLPSTKKNYRFIFVVIDAFSKFVWLYPTKSTDAAEVLRRLESQATIFGNPNRIISDRGTAFTSHAFEEYCQRENIEHILITTGMPRSNGQVERVNRTLIPLLTKMASPKPEEWHRHIELAQKYLNSTPSRSIGTTPFHILFGTHMRLAEDQSVRQMIEDEWIALFQENRDDVRKHAKNAISKVQAENRANYNKKRKKARRYIEGDSESDDT